MAAGLFGAGLMYLLFNAEHLAFGYHAGDLESGAWRAPRRPGAPRGIAAGAGTDGLDTA